MDAERSPAPTRRRVGRIVAACLGLLVVLGIGFVAGSRLGGGADGTADEPSLRDTTDFTRAAVLDDASTAAARGTSSISVDPSQSESLNDLVASLETGGELVLGPGRYEVPRPLLIDDAITIRGAGAGETQLVGTATGPAVLDIRSLGDVRIEDVTIVYEGTNVSDVLRVRAGTATIERCVVTGGSSGGSGLVVSGAATLTVTECALDRNAGNGLRALDQAAVVIDSSSASDNGRSGFAFGAQTRVTVTASTANGNAASGFASEARAVLIADGNIANDNDDFGFVWLGNASGEATANEARDNGRSGFAIIDEASPELRANSSLGNRGAGFAWLDDATGLAEDNLATGNRRSGLLVLDAAAPRFGANEASENGGPGISWLSESERFAVGAAAKADTVDPPDA